MRARATGRPAAADMAKSGFVPTFRSPSAYSKCLACKAKLEPGVQERLYTRGKGAVIVSLILKGGRREGDVYILLSHAYCLPTLG